jgi:hypothetical protein
MTFWERLRALWADKSPVAAPAHSFDFEPVRKLGGGRLKQSQVDGINVILKASEGLDVTWRAYLLATAWWETARTMQPVRETLAATDAAAVNRLEDTWQAGRLPSVRTPYWRFDAEGKTWLGRGYVQLTHKKNYARAGREIGVDLLGNPDLAMKPEHAAAIRPDHHLRAQPGDRRYRPGDHPL